MAFAADTAITTDADFLNILGIQNIADLKRGGGAWDDGANNLHTEAVNHIIRRLRPAIDPAKVTNQTTAKEYAITWIAERIYSQRALDSGSLPEAERWASRAEVLAGRLERLWREFYRDIAIDEGSDAVADRRVARSMPQVMNIDSGGRFAGNKGRSVRHNRGMPNHDDAVQDGGTDETHHPHP